MRALVTGAGGFIGRRVSERLERDGHEVIRVVRAGGHDEAATRDGFTLHLDLCEPCAIQRALSESPDVLVHLAAVIPSSFTGADAARAAQLNRRIDENVFLACREMKAVAVYASGTSVYGPGSGEVKSETSPAAPVGDYVAAKLAGEQTGERLLSEHGVPFTVLRISAPYGPGQRARTVLRLFIERAMKGLPLLYHGTGSRQQDFTYVDDVADAVSKACAFGRGGLYNIASGRPVTMRRLAELVLESLPSSSSRVEASGEEDAQEGAVAAYSIERAEQLLGWRPRVSLEAGIKACIENWTR